jgi:hypothetical protein
MSHNTVFSDYETNPKSFRKLQSFNYPRNSPAFMELEISLRVHKSSLLVTVLREMNYYYYYYYYSSKNNSKLNLKKGLYLVKGEHVLAVRRDAG